MPDELDLGRGRVVDDGIVGRGKGVSLGDLNPLKEPLEPLSDKGNKGSVGGSVCEGDKIVSGSVEAGVLVQGVNEGDGLVLGLEAGSRPVGELGLKSGKGGDEGVALGGQRRESSVLEKDLFEEVRSKNKKKGTKSLDRGNRGRSVSRGRGRKGSTTPTRASIAQ